MNRKVIECLILLFSFLFVFIILIHSNSMKYNDLIIDDVKWNKIVSTRQETDTSLIKKLNFNGYDLLLDNNKEWFYSIVENQDNQYNPLIKYETDDNVKIAILNKKISDELILDNDDIKLIAYNDKFYIIYTIKCTTLPIMNISYDNNAEFLEDTDTNVNMYLFDNRENSFQRVIKSDGKVHIRGRMSKLFEKKSFKLSLVTYSVGNHERNNNLSLLGMRQDDDWILDAMYSDQEKVRNAYSANLWTNCCSKNNMFNIDNGVEYHYIELFLNNNYWGIYTLGFPVDEKILKLKNSNSEHNDDEYVFKKFEGGYSEVEILTNDTKEMGGYRLVSKNLNSEAGWTKLKEYYKMMQSSNNIEELYQISDINNVIDVYLFLQYIYAVDNFSENSINNMYITFKNMNNNSIALYTPWDLDLSFGNIYSEYEKNYVMMYKVPYNTYRPSNMFPIYFIQQLGDNNINKLIRERYNELRKTYWSVENINKMIDEYEDYIYNSGAFLRDKDKWPDGSHNNEKVKLGDFRKYALNRLEFMDNYIYSLHIN